MYVKITQKGRIPYLLYVGERRTGKTFTQSKIMSQKTTQRDLAMELSQLDKEGELRPLIANCLNNVYHCFKSQLATPKMQLLDDLHHFAHELDNVDLIKIRSRVINGEFDEAADESDLAKMSGWLADENAPEMFYEILGLPKPE